MSGGCTSTHDVGYRCCEMEGCYVGCEFGAAIDACYGFSERLVASEAERLYDFHFWSDSEQEREENTVQTTALERTEDASKELLDDVWAEHAVTSTPSLSTLRDRSSMSIRNELAICRADFSARRYTASDSKKYWLEVHKEGKLPRLCQVARLLLTIPASAISQE